jgi:hypothetical protein
MFDRLCLLAAQQPLACTAALYRAETAKLKRIPFCKNHRILAILLLALSAWIVIAF